MWKNLHPVINESKLRSYHRPTFTQQQETSLTVIMPSQESTVQEVKRIPNSRRRGDRLQYLVKWQGKDSRLRNPHVSEISFFPKTLLRIFVTVNTSHQTWECPPRVTNWESGRCCVMGVLLMLRNLKSSVWNL